MTAAGARPFNKSGTRMNLLASHKSN